MTKIAGSGSISQRHGSADPDPDPDPHQNVMDPQHWENYNTFTQKIITKLLETWVGKNLSRIPGLDPQH
jgi:hypothetical protein